MKMEEETKRERHIRLFTERLTKINHDFDLQKNSLHEKTMEELNQHLTQLYEGNHPELLYRGGKKPSKEIMNLIANIERSSDEQAQKSKNYEKLEFEATEISNMIKPDTPVSSSRKRLLEAELKGKLERERDEALWKAEWWKNYMLEICDKMYEEEVKLAEKEYKAEKDGLKGSLLKQIEESRRKLREEEQNLTIESSSLLDESSEFLFSSRQQQSRKLRRRNADSLGSGSQTDGNSSSRNPRNAARRPPNQMASLDFPLKDHEVMEDLMIFNRLGNLSGYNGSSRKGITNKRLRYR